MAQKNQLVLVIEVGSIYKCFLRNRISTKQSLTYVLLAEESRRCRLRSDMAYPQQVGLPLPLPRGRRSARAPKNAPSSLQDCERCEANIPAARPNACNGRTRARLPQPHPATTSILTIRRAHARDLLTPSGVCREQHHAYASILTRPTTPPRCTRYGRRTRETHASPTFGTCVHYLLYRIS